MLDPISPSRALNFQVAACEAPPNDPAMRPLPNHKWWLRAHDREAVELVVVVVVVLEKVVVAVVAGAGVPVGSFCHPLGTTVSALRI